MDLIRQQAYAGQAVDVPVIDAHTHMGLYHHSGWSQALASMSDVIALMDHLGIDAAVTAPHALVYGNMEAANRQALQLTREHPGRIFGYISICPQAGLDTIKAQLDTFGLESGFVGMKFLAGYHGQLNTTEYRYALDFAVEHRCPVLCHTWSNNPSIEDIESVVSPRPGLKLMLAHQGGGSAECTDRVAELMTRHPSLRMELCGSLHNTYSVEDLVEKVGPDRLIFGTDMINLDPRFDLGRVIFSTLDDDIKRNILAANYLSLLDDSSMGQIALSS